MWSLFNDILKSNTLGYCRFWPCFPPQWHMSTWNKINDKANRRCEHPCLQLNPTDLWTGSQNVGTFTWLWNLALLNSTSSHMPCATLAKLFPTLQPLQAASISGMILTRHHREGPFSPCGLGFNITSSGRPFLNLLPYKILHVHAFYFLASWIVWFLHRTYRNFKVF